MSVSAKASSALAPVIQCVNAWVPGQLASGEIPDDTQLTSRPFVIVTRSGGPSTMVTDMPTLLVECFHPTRELEAETLCNQVREALDRHQHFAGVYKGYRLIRWRETQGPTSFRHPSGAHRLQFMGTATVPKL